MKILQISSASSFGGGERHFADLINSLAARGHDVYAAIRPASPLLGKIAHLPRDNVRLVPLRNALDVPSANELARFARQAGAEIIHAHMARDYPLAAFAARRSKAKLVLTRHVLFPLNRFQNRVIARASRVIAVSEAVAISLRTRNSLLPGQLSVVNNGIEIERFNDALSSANRSDLMRTWGFPENCLVVGTVGELNPLKGHDVFLQTAAQVIAANPNARFIVVGGDSSPRSVTANALKRLAEELHLLDHVRFLGPVDEVAPLLATMDIFVSASQTESFGLAIVEALASRLPVVATATEGAREIIKPGTTGFLVPLGRIEELTEAIKRLLSDASLRRRIGMNAYQDACNRFRLEHMVDSIETIYGESLNPNYPN